MATAGHFITMLGVLSFYFMILDSKLEKKMVGYLHSLVARFNKRALYYLGKIVQLKLQKDLVSFVPSAKALEICHAI
ncbi:MAG: hypothetical protein IPP99_22900 [Chitinophagaceae bacterium]|jgi:hypothetical protein|nr:hypothetical protein [Chitinophagaceae bacterium]